MGNLFYGVLNMSVTGAVMIAAVMLLRICFKKLPRRFSYALWIIPAVRLLCPVAVSSAVSIFNLFGTPVNDSRMEYISSSSEQGYSSSVNITEYEDIAGENLQKNAAALNEPTAVNTQRTDRENAYPVNENTVRESGRTSANAPKTADLPDGIAAADIAGAIWLCGGLCVLICTAVGWERVRRRIKGAEKSGDIYICGNIETPFVFGIIHPEIYVPRGISDEDLRCVIAHERAHISRGDHLLKLLCIPITAVHWFNPFVWIGCRLMTDDMELSCDEKALASLGLDERKTYASALLNMSMRQSRLSLGGALSFGESGIKGRIKGILGAKAPAKAAVIAAVAVICAAAVCLLTNARNDDSSDNNDFINLDKYDEFSFVSADGAAQYKKSEIKDFINVISEISPQRVSGFDEAPENYLFSLVCYEDMGIMSAVDSDGVRFFTLDTEDGEIRFLAQLWSSADYPDCKYYSVTNEEMERLYGSFYNYAAHSFTGTVSEAHGDEYTLAPDPIGGKPFMYFDFSYQQYSILANRISGGGNVSVSVKGERGINIGDRVRVTYYGNDMTENVKLEKTDSPKCFINVKNDLKSVNLEANDEDGPNLRQRIEEFELTPANKSAFFERDSFNTVYTLELREGAYATRITFPSPEAETADNSDSQDSTRCIILEKNYQDFRSIPEYYEISEDDRDFLINEICRKYDPPFPAGTYERIYEGDPNLEERVEKALINIDVSGNITVSTTDPTTGETVAENFTAAREWDYKERLKEEQHNQQALREQAAREQAAREQAAGEQAAGDQLYGYVLQSDKNTMHLKYKGAGVIRIEPDLASSFAYTACGTYVLTGASEGGSELTAVPEPEKTESEEVTSYTEHSVVMPDNDIRTNEILKQMPAFYLSFNLPEGWTVKTPKRNEQTYLSELFTPVNIYDAGGELAGTAALGLFNESVDPEEENAHLTVYKSLRESWQENYTPVKQDYFTQNAYTKTDFSESGNLALYYDGMEGVFAAVRFKEGAVTEKQCREIAESLIMYEYFDTPRDIIEKFVRSYYSGLGSGYFYPREFTDNPRMREYLDLKLQYERSLDLSVGANEIYFFADRDHYGSYINEYGEKTFYYSLDFNLTSDYYKYPFGADLELVRKDGGWRMHKGVIYTTGDVLAFGFSEDNIPRPPVEYDLQAGIEKLKEEMSVGEDLTETDESTVHPRDSSDISYTQFQKIMQVGTKDEYDGVSFSADSSSFAALAMDIPDYAQMNNTVGYVDGEKAFEIMGAVWRAEEGFSPEGMKTDMVSGRTVTVYEEQTGTGLYEYMLHSSVPDVYSENGIYEKYTYIVKRGDYMASVSFLAGFYSKDMAEHMLNSLVMEEFDPEGINYGAVTTGFTHHPESGSIRGGINNVSDLELAVLLNMVLTKRGEDGEYHPVIPLRISTAPEKAQTIFIPPGEMCLITIDITDGSVFSEDSLALGEARTVDFIWRDIYDITPGEYRLENICWYREIGGDDYDPRLSKQITAEFTVYEETESPR